MPRNSIITASGIYHPEKYMSKDDFAAKYGPDILPFFDKTHINGKYICAENESSLDLAVNASKDALKNAGLTPQDIDLIILSTDTPAFLSPATSVAVQGLIGAKNAGTFDINCACAGFVTALITANNFIKGDEKINRVLVIGTYAMTKYIKENDPFTEPLLGDGAGAVILEVTDSNRGIISTKLKALGEYYDYLGIFGCGTVYPPTFANIAKGYQYVKFAKKFPATINEENWPILVKEVLANVNMNTDNVNWTIFTQVNFSAIDTVHKTLNIPIEKTITVMDKYGYTGSACIPMAIYRGMTEGKFKQNDIITMCASGGGANFAALAMKW